MSNDAMPSGNGVFFLQMRNGLAAIICCLFAVTSNHLPEDCSEQQVADAASLAFTPN